MATLSCKSHSGPLETAAATHFKASSVLNVHRSSVIAVSVVGDDDGGFQEEDLNTHSNPHIRFISYCDHMIFDLKHQAANSLTKKGQAKAFTLAAGSPQVFNNMYEM